MNRILALLSAVALLVTLAACTPITPSTPDGTTTATATASGETTTTATTAVTTTATTTTTTTTTKPTVKPTVKPTTTTTTTTRTTTTTTAAPTMPAVNTPLLYRAFNPDTGSEVWMFGSVHLGGADVFPLPNYVMNAYRACDSVAVEFNMLAFEEDLIQQITALSIMQYQHGNTIRDRIHPDVYAAAVAILQTEGVYTEELDSYMPVMWANFIESAAYENANLNMGMGIDRYFAESAECHRKRILEIESAEYQYQVMAGFSDRLQEQLLVSAIATYYSSVTQADLNRMVALWAVGDPDTLNEILNPVPTFANAEEERLYNEYHRAMVTLRIQRMADLADSVLIEKYRRCFLVVGTSYLVGDDSLPNLLSKWGYVLERIRPQLA